MESTAFNQHSLKVRVCPQVPRKGWGEEGWGYQGGTLIGCHQVGVRLALMYAGQLEGLVAIRY